MIPEQTKSSLVLQHLLTRGILQPDEQVTTGTLDGGVSNDILTVTSERTDIVVKRALSQLRVEQAWYADTSRLDTEGKALLLAQRFCPSAVPLVLDLSDGYLALERAPRSWRSWKDDLLKGHADAAVAGRLGEFLGIWQRETSLIHEELEAHFGDRTVFEQLRVTPFHRQIRQEHPDLADAIDCTIQRMSDDRRCLVHGDYSPKNILVGTSAQEVWVLDWEVAHLGDPAFDPAWIIGHLILKSLRRPAMAESYLTLAQAFLTGLNEVENRLEIDMAQVLRQVGCLILARVDGRSPVNYLDIQAQQHARRLGRHILSATPQTLNDIWKEIR